MGWFTVLKKVEKHKFTEAELMLFNIFNVPLEISPTLNIPRSLVQRMRLKGNLETINEQEFNKLMQLSDEGKYQELVDTLIVLLDTAARHRNREQKVEFAREHRKTPEYKKYIREYHQRPEVRERKNLNARKRYRRRR